MTTGRLLVTSALGAALLVVGSDLTAQPAAPRYYNTVKQKLADGKQVVGGTVSIPDPDVYCAVANAGFDFTWIEMQHSPLTYQDVARMICVPRRAGDAVHPRRRTRRKATSRRRPTSARSASSSRWSIPSRRRRRR